jgi:hypothetical protein
MRPRINFVTLGVVLAWKAASEAEVDRMSGRIRLP